MLFLVNSRHYNIQRKADTVHDNRLSEPSFARKHSKALTFLGSALVLLTFIVKDAWRENLKNFVDAADAAQSTFLLRSDEQRVDFQLRAIEQRLVQLEAKSETKDEVARYRLGAIYDEIEIYRQREQGIGVSLDNISSLLDILPSEMLAKRLKTLRDAFSRAKQSRDGLDRELSHDIDKYAGKPIPIEPFMHLSGGVSSYSNDLTAIANGSETLAKDALREVTQEKQQKERYFQWATWASYALYPAGWLLALIGSLYHIEGLQP